MIFLYKDRRYTVDKFFLHLPIKLNCNAAESSYLNEDVRKAIKNCDKNYVIGIDRGERNLIYICVIDSDEKIVEQISLNEIINSYNGIEHRVDYQNLLAQKAKDRTKERQDWKTVENIKELKEGYLSQVVSKICELVKKYDAIICLEDLNYGFKNSRIERQVYQKFENMLVSKLNFLADKKEEPVNLGGLLNAYQLTNKVGNTYKSMQNGFIFYVPAWMTSKIDPTTGFANLLRFHYESIEKSKKIIECIDKIYYSKKEEMFAFDINYENFNRGSLSAKKKWTLYSNGTRIKTYRNKDKNSEWDNEEIDLTDAFKDLFKRYNIKYDADDFKAEILAINEKNFYEQFLELMKLVVQMRNSITNNVEVDYLISPVKNSEGKFYDSRNYGKTDLSLPKDADANGAYNIARKGLWACNKIKATKEDELAKAKLGISNKEWLEFAQNG